MKKHVKAINKDMIKKWVSGLIILFFAMTMLFQKDTPEKELQFVRNMDEVFMHNAADTQRDYLFENEEGENTYNIEMNNGSTTNTTDNTNTLDTLINSDEVNQIVWSQNQTEKIYTVAMWTWIQEPKATSIYTGNLDCITPRKEEVKNQDFVIAYEQRADVNTICNVEKRVCMSGTLGWSFSQRSCKDNVVYNYRKAEVVSYNQKVLNEYIQPTAPANSWAVFNTQGKLDVQSPAIDNRWTSNNPVGVQSGAVAQTVKPSKKSCTTPRGQTIKNGQFTKAYKVPRGFIDLPCEVQIRPCIDGSLKWTYTYTTCTAYNTTYDDYITAGSPSSNTGFLFFERIKNIFRRR